MTTAGRFAVFTALFMTVASFAAPIPCTTGTAADYVALGATGCVDPNGVVISGFTVSTAGALNVPLSTILVTLGAPDTSGDPNHIFFIPGLTLTLTPAAVIPPSSTAAFTAGVTFTMPPGLPFRGQAMASWVIFWGLQLLSPPPQAIPVSFHSTISEDGNLLADTTDCCLGLGVPLQPGLSASILNTYFWTTPSNTQVSLTKFEFAARTQLPVPEPASQVGIFIALGLATLLRMRARR